MKKPDARESGFFQLIRAKRTLEVQCEQVYRSRVRILEDATDWQISDHQLVCRAQVAPVTFRYNAERDTLDIGGPDNSKLQKFRNIARNDLASFVVDDRTSQGGSGIEIRAHAEVVAEGGQAIQPDFSPELIRLTPKRIISWDRSGKTLPWPSSRRNV